jgi:hypothetical protein
MRHTLILDVLHGLAQAPIENVACAQYTHTGRRSGIIHNFNKHLKTVNGFSPEQLKHTQAMLRENLRHGALKPRLLTKPRHTVVCGQKPWQSPDRSSPSHTLPPPRVATARGETSPFPDAGSGSFISRALLIMHPQNLGCKPPGHKRSFNLFPDAFKFRSPQHPRRSAWIVLKSARPPAECFALRLRPRFFFIKSLAFSLEHTGHLLRNKQGLLTRNDDEIE